MEIAWDPLRVDPEFQIQDRLQRCQSHPWLEGEKRKHFVILRIKWGERLLAGKRGFCPQRVEKSSSRQLPKQHLPI